MTIEQSSQPDTEDSESIEQESSKEVESRENTTTEINRMTPAELLLDNSKNAKTTKLTTGKLRRQTITFSRELEFFTKSELRTQTGYSEEHWHEVILKELLDNGLDGCETAGIPPVITVGIDRASVYVQDNGAGITPEKVLRIIDFKTRTSDKAVYPCPTRGRQGNALKSILAIPFVLSGEISHMVIESMGVRHNIQLKVDAIAGKPDIRYDQEQIVKTNGTKITVYTSIILEDQIPKFLQIVRNFELLSPHLTLTLKGFFDEDDIVEMDNPLWKKWSPKDNTSPHWYSVDDFKRLIGSYIANARDNGGRDYTLREFVREFDGLAGNKKTQLVTNLFPTVKKLSNLVLNDNELDLNTISYLLSAMKREAKPVLPENLGIIGELHIRRFFHNDEIQYVCRRHKGAIPFIVEAAFGYIEGLDHPKYTFALNFSPLFSGYDPLASTPLFGDKGKYGYGIAGLSRVFHLDEKDNGWLIVHVVHPCLKFIDKGKGRIEPDSALREEVELAVATVLKGHYKLRNKTDKEAEAKEREQRKLEEATRTKKMSLKDAVFQVLPQAIERAAEGNHHFKERQLLYQVRPLVKQYTDKEINASYFSPPLLSDYEKDVKEIPGLIFDGRGHFHEPHRDIDFELGTEEVNEYEIPDYEFAHHFRTLRQIVITQSLW